MTNIQYTRRVKTTTLQPHLRPGFSTQAALIKIIDITTAKKLDDLPILLDFSKPFDFLNHCILITLTKLNVLYPSPVAHS